MCICVSVYADRPKDRRIEELFGINQSRLNSSEAIENAEEVRVGTYESKPWEPMVYQWGIPQIVTISAWW